MEHVVWMLWVMQLPRAHCALLQLHQQVHGPPPCTTTNTTTAVAVICQVLAGQRPATCVASSSGALGELVAAAWAQDPAARPTAAALLEQLAACAK